MDATLFLGCFFTYLAGIILFGWWVSRHKQSGEDFLLGGRSLPFPTFTLGTTVATMVGTGSSMGAVGKGLRERLGEFVLRDRWHHGHTRHGLALRPHLSRSPRRTTSCPRNK